MPDLATTSDVRVSQLWRYPVKSLGGEALQSGRLTPDGIEGDRIVHVAGPHGALTGRTRHGLLTLAGSTDVDGVPLVDGFPWDSPEAAEIVRVHGGPDARLVADVTPERFDVLNLLVATDGAVARFGYDVRRLRPNIVLSGIPPDVEPELPGQAFAIGDALIGVHSVRQRCVVTTIDSD
ncbi:MAG TPA: MOSC N-terminal beta barrel domain-containing protein, partial [Actinomycetes bacterium]|nr:MOSC N-terminal beta barrel domain-containing protein [Actinomycetes bacterium]